MKLEGVYKKNIYHSEEGYTIGLFKIKKCDNKDLIDKTITFTGYFPSINLDDNLIIEGEFIHHHRYGEQFNVKNYEIMLPSEEDGIIDFLSSEMFPGIGKSKAQKIYDHFGNDTINIIKTNPERLKEVKTLTKKNINTIQEEISKYDNSIDIIIKLNNLGFTSKDSTTLYNKYKEKIIEIIENNVYDLIVENTPFTFKKIDYIALNNHYLKEDKRRIKAGICYVINEVINTVGDTYLYYQEIHVFLKRALLIDITTDDLNICLQELILEDKIIYNDNKFYIKKMWDAENNISKRLVYLNNQKDNNYKNLDKILKQIEENNSIVYNEEQLLAIKNAFIKNFLIITGGPGTGKTTIIKTIVDVYKNLFKVNPDKLEEEVVLLAPTGRASKRIMESVGMKSLTIHRFLKWNKENNRFAINEYNKVNAKLVIIDEASMVDTYLLDSLLKGLRYDTKIILVGDYNQLPSVGSGQVLKDLIETKIFTVIKLERLYRQEENSNIITLAYDINEGNLNLDIFNKDYDLTFMECDSYNLLDKFQELCNSYKNYNYNDLVILAPMYKTINGIDNLNLVAREIFNPLDNQKEIQIGDIKYRENDKVIELVNMPDSNVYNGDIGVITEIDLVNKEIYVDYDGNIVKYTKNIFSNFKLGYVISIHKSQGSEFKVVIMILLNEYMRMLYRKLFYTGVTRAKKNLYLLGEVSAINKAIINNNVIERKTTLLDFVLKMYE